MKTLAAIIASIGLVLALAACNTETVIAPAMDANGKILTDANGNVLMKTTTTKESAARHKSFGVSAGGTVLTVKTSASTDSSTSATPQVTIGTESTTVSSTPEDDNKPVVSINSQAGILTSLTSSSAKSYSLTYVGVRGETASETAARLNAVKAFTESSSADSSTSN